MTSRDSDGDKDYGWQDQTFKDALDSLPSLASALFKNNSSITDQDLDSCDEEEICAVFKKALSDYSRVIKACRREGLEVDNDTPDIQEEYTSTPSISKRLEIIANLREQIVSMMDSCEKPPKDIINRYSEDLVSRIEGNIIDDGFEVDDS